MLIVILGFFLFCFVFGLGIGGVAIIVKAVQKSKTRLRGACPWCGTVLLGNPPGFNCPACANRVIARNNTFMRAPR